jgi:hypothetical protein
MVDYLCRMFLVGFQFFYIAMVLVLLVEGIRGRLRVRLFRDRTARSAGYFHTLHTGDSPAQPQIHL